MLKMVEIQAGACGAAGLTHLGISDGKSIFCSLKRAISDFKFRLAKMRKLATLKQFAFFNASRNLKFFPKWLKVARKKAFTISLKFKCVYPVRRRGGFYK
ncbi:MAG: hypothetical protein BBJ57_08325 [Desulfobacterales bacterium PC51MH44]|nr:MAG: hypothetical protein BBJ57_08325 [Desulfobacterales bacterium PC51MH44]